MGAGPRLRHLRHDVLVADETGDRRRDPFQLRRGQLQVVQNVVPQRHGFEDDGVRSGRWGAAWAGVPGSADEAHAQGEDGQALQDGSGDDDRSQSRCKVRAEPFRVTVAGAG